MSSACAYRDGNTDGPMYDSNGKKCDTMNHTTKMLLIAGCSAAGAALVALGIYWLIRRARISRRSSQSEDGNNGVPARPLSAWVGQPGTMASGSNGYQYDTDGVDYQKYAARSRASSYMKAPDGSYSPVVGYAEEQQGLGYVPGSPSGSSMQQQQQQGNYYMQQQQQQQASYDPAATPTKRTSALKNNTNRRSYYDSNQQQHQPRGLPVPPQSAAMPPIRRYSQTSQEQDLNGDVYQYNYNYDNQDGRVRSPSPSRNRAASPSAYYAHRQSREYDQGYAYDGQGQGMEEEGRERVEMLSPDLRYIQPGR